MLKKQIHNKQSGMTAIMLAMFLAIVISLLAVGFATLVRKDQTETLDKTLSYQAQYAAESGINKIISYIDSTPNPIVREGCGDNQVAEGAPETSFNIGQAQITCAVWDFNLKETVATPSKDKSFTGGFTNVNSINVKWQSSGGVYDSASPSLPGSLEDNKPVISMSIAQKDNFNTIKHYYIVPTAEVNSYTVYSPGYSFETVPAIANATCDTASKNCSIKVDGFNISTEYLVNLSFLNYSDDSGSITIDSTGEYKNTTQYKIDVNAKAQDITKRVIVYYSKENSGGPSSVLNVSSSGMCKNYQVDGMSNNNAADGASVCPN